jgi:hypothetical protein
MALGKKTGGKNLVMGFDPRRHVRCGPVDFRQRKLRRDLFEHYVHYMPDELLDVLEARGHIPALIERYFTRVLCLRPQGGGRRWRAVRPWRDVRAMRDDESDDAAPRAARTGRR